MNRKEARKAIAEFKDYQRIGMRLRDFATWHINRNLIDGSDDKTQYMKLVQEMGELSDNICKGRDIRDDVGDMLVVLTNICVRNNVSFISCLDAAWEDIKDRKGVMYNGVFVKSTDPSYEQCRREICALTGIQYRPEGEDQDGEDE